MAMKNKLEWCLEKGKLGAKHKGVRQIMPSAEEGKRHMEKARHNEKRQRY